MVTGEASSPPIVIGHTFCEVRERERDREMDHGREREVGDEGEGEGDGGKKEWHRGCLLDFFAGKNG